MMAISVCACVMSSVCACSRPQTAVPDRLQKQKKQLVLAMGIAYGGGAQGLITNKESAQAVVDCLIHGLDREHRWTEGWNLSLAMSDHIFKLPTLGGQPHKP